MTQIIEYSKHSNHYLIHHFSFECNDKCAIGKFTGNCSLDKFMSLSDWQMILDYLSEPIENYIKDPSKKLMAVTRQLINTNFELHVTWCELDASFYSKLLDFLDFDVVFPFVVKVKICLQSNIDKFATLKSSAVCNRISANSFVEYHKTIDDSIEAITNGEHNESIKIKECFVRLPQLRFDENGRVIEGVASSQKRKRNSLMAAKKYPLKHVPRHIDEHIDDPNELFMCSSSSTPFVKNVGVATKQIEQDVRGTFAAKHKKAVKRLTNRLTTTPRSSNDRKTGSFNPRIRLLKLPDNMNNSKKMKKKKIAKLKSAAGKRLKVKAQSIANETELFEVPVQPKPKIKKDPPTDEQSNTVKSSPAIADAVKVEEMDLKSLTEDELTKAFDDHHDNISNLFHNYLKQTNDSIQKAGDYNPFDMISLLSTDQFSFMLDILFDKFVKIAEFGGISYDTLFLELLIPEWVLAIYMKRHSFDRDTAIKRITAQKSNQNQSYESYTTLISTKIDETMNISKI